jgi:ribosome-binding protein aMBF1 (putative translation factor)
MEKHFCDLCGKQIRLCSTNKVKLNDEEIETCNGCFYKIKKLIGDLKKRKE